VVAHELGRWDPMRPQRAATELAGLPTPWWIAGGWAIDLLLGRQSRVHGDLDVLILRRDHTEVREHLADWDLHAADPPGTLRPWPVGEVLPVHVHDVWCRRDAGSAWELQLMIDDTDGDDWVFRRDARIRRPIAALSGRASTATLPVLSPDVQLLYKSKGLREKDVADFEVIRPHLASRERDSLRAALETASPGHPWIERL